VGFSSVERLRLNEALRAELRADLAAGRIQEAVWLLRERGFREAADLLERKLEENLRRISSADVVGEPTRLEGGTTEGYVLTLRGGQRAIFKPESDRVGVDPVSEEWMYRLDRLLGIHQVPLTTRTFLAVPAGSSPRVGSLQYFVDGLTIGDQSVRNSEMLLLDFLAGNLDRHPGNRGLRRGRSVLIDGGAAGLSGSVTFTSLTYAMQDLIPQYRSRFSESLKRPSGVDGDLRDLINILAGTPRTDWENAFQTWVARRPPAEKNILYQFYRESVTRHQDYILQAVGSPERERAIRYLSQAQPSEFSSVPSFFQSRIRSAQNAARELFQLALQIRSERSR
jgi:hypothetical protein